MAPVVWAQAVDPHAHHTPADAAPDPLAMTNGREASGTSWLPEETVLGGAMIHRGPWMLMLHGNAFLQYVATTGDRGDQQFGSINWVMGMARRPLGGGQFTARVMGSAEPVTVGRCGYPDLVQTGEECRGVRLYDRQHPHDLLMELAAHYTRPVGRNLSLEFYGGPAGEPALGPVAFPHRVSALAQPLAPVSHHWLDATHVTFGVVTAGIAGRSWKVEASAFNGREPDDARYDLDVARLDSVSGRVWWTPTRRMAMQVSSGLLSDVHDGEDVRRTTASFTYHRPINQRVWATTAAWGMNDDHDGTSHAVLVESSIDLTAHDTTAIRVEVVPRTADELAIPGDPHASFTLTKIQGVYTRWGTRRFGLTPGIGVGAGFARLPAAFESTYGTRTPLEISVFLTLRP